MDIKLFKETLAGMEGGEALLEFFQSHDNTLRGDIEKAKQKKGEVVNEKSEIETVLNGMLEKLQAKTPDEATGKITEFETKLQKALEDFNGLNEKFTQSESEKIEAKKLAEKTQLDSDITGALSKMKISDESGIIKDAMLKRSKKDDSGQYLINGEQSFTDFLQGQIDDEVPMFKEKTILERPPQEQVANDAGAREAMGLPPKE
jgi:hypothetical protein